MAAHSNRPLGRRLQARMMRVINVPMRVVLGLPLATPLSGRLMLVFLTGRKTGKSYRQPVSYVRQGTTLLTPGGGKWKLNLQDGQPERIRLRGRDVLARPELVSDLDEIERLLGVMTAANPRVSTFVAIPTGPDGRLDRPRLETAVKYGFRIVRWHLDSQSARTADGRPSQSQLRAKVRRRPEALEMRGPAIAVDELRKDFGTVLALDGLSLDVAPGKVMGLLGPNGLLRPVDPACEGRSYCLKRR